jgi:4-hydroxy-3-methylbut-2-enyl diphosphate reductase
MRVTVAKSAGFCSGVRRALKIAYETAEQGGDVFMLGGIVHNEDVLRDIAAAGIVQIHELADGNGATLLISAHGVPLETLERARELGYRVVDATCPMVKAIHRTALELEQAGRTVIVIGDRDHDEVRGIVGQLQTEAIVVDSVADVDGDVMKAVDKAGVVVQSTQNEKRVRALVDELGQYVSDLEFHDTICKPTRVKQREIMSLPVDNDAMIIIGSKTSANTGRLYELSKSLNERTYWVRSVKDIDPSWFEGAETVGVGAGASTPDEITAAVVAYLQEL